MKDSIKGMYKSLFVLILTVLMAFSTTQAQNVIPGFQLIQKQEQANNARYRFKKGNRTLAVVLKKVGNKVNIRILNAQRNLIGAASVTPSGNYGRTIVVNQTRDGLFGIMAFAFNRTMNNQGSMALLRTNAEGNSKLMDCIDECSQENLKKIIQADLKGNLVEAVSTLASSVGDTGGCGDINICTEEYLNTYDDCVEECYSTHEGTDDKN